METIIAYGATAAAVFLAITALPIAAGGGLLARTFGFPLKFSAFIAACLTWFLIALLWQWLEGGQLPIAAVGAAIVFITMHGIMQADRLSASSIHMMHAETLALVVAAIALIAFTSPIRWW